MQTQSFSLFRLPDLNAHEIVLVLYHNPPRLSIFREKISGRGFPEILVFPSLSGREYQKGDSGSNDLLSPFFYKVFADAGAALFYVFSSIDVCR